MTRPIAVLVVLGALTVPAGASEDERALSLSASYSAVGDIADGFDIGIAHDRGIRDNLFWHFSGGGGLLFGDVDLIAGHATIGFKYLLFDIVKYVPYVTLGGGASVISGDGIDTDVNGRIELGIGLDKLSSRKFSYGIEARLEVTPPRAAFDQSALFMVGAKVAWRWGFF